MDRAPKELYIQCLPLPREARSAFYQNLLEVRADVASKLRGLGVKVVDTYSEANPSRVLLLFQSTGRIGDELPAALGELPPSLKNRTIAFAAIHDDEYGRVGRDALPPDFQPDCLLDFCVVPMTTRLKDCRWNETMLRQLAFLVRGQPAGEPFVQGPSLTSRWAALSIKSRVQIALLICLAIFVVVPTPILLVCLIGVSVGAWRFFIPQRQ